MQFTGTIDINSPTVLGGGGTVLLSGATLTSASTGLHTLITDNLITGAGDLRMLTLVNNGTINANGGVLQIIPTATANSLTNFGLLSADVGTLVLGGVGIANVNGSIEAHNNSLVTITAPVIGGGISGLGNGTVTVAGGMQNVAFSGKVQALGASSAAFWSGIASNAGTLTFVGNTTINPTSATVNTAYTLFNIGLVQINNSTNLFIDGPVTFSGGGSVSLLGPSATITGTGNTNTTFTTDNVITGQGTLAAAALFNSGTISATTGLLTLNFTSGTNTGALIANGGTLAVGPNMTLTNNGTLLAASGLLLIQGTVNGGSVVVLPAGKLSVSGGSLPSLLDNSGSISISGGSLGGVISNHSQMQWSGAISLTSDLTLTSGGTVLLTSATLTGAHALTSDNFLTGTGSLGMRSLNNSGTINANGGVLQIIPTATAGGITNTGLLSADIGTLSSSAEPASLTPTAPSRPTTIRSSRSGAPHYRRQHRRPWQRDCGLSQAVSRTWRSPEISRCTWSVALHFLERHGEQCGDADLLLAILGLTPLALVSRPLIRLPTRGFCK